MYMLWVTSDLLVAQVGPLCTEVGEAPGRQIVSLVVRGSQVREGLLYQGTGDGMRQVWGTPRIMEPIGSLVWPGFPHL